MQLLKPIQSTRRLGRAALRVQRPIFHAGGRYFRTYFSARFIACSWLRMQRRSHLQI